MIEHYKKFKSPTPLSGFYIAYWGSTMNEHKGIYGISHLMEHLVCKGFDKYMEDFERDAIEWNACTSDKDIIFYMMGMDKHVKKWKKIFYDNIQDFNITEEQFQTEKKIVIEEYKDSFNQQGDAHFQNLFRKLYGHYEAIGLLEDLQGLTFKDCQQYFELQYRKPTMIIDVSQSINGEEEKFFSNVVFDDRDYLDKKLTFEINEKFPYEKGNKYKDKTSIINLSPIIHENFPHIKFINMMLGGGLKSPFYKEIREKHGLVYFFYVYQREITNNSVVSILQTETSNKNVKKVQELTYKILNSPDDYLTQERFNITKEYYTNKFEKENILIHNNGHKYTKQEQFSLEKILPTLTYDDIRIVYDKYYDFSNFYKSIDKKEFTNI
jgi:zinc protease